MAITRLILENFMAHARTEFALAPGLNVLTGPNNTGKSAVVEALRCLAANPAPRHVIRHGASEARVTLELDDGTAVTWVRRPKYALYELTRPGAAEPEVFAKFGRTPPEEISRVLRLSPVPIEGGEPVDVHIGNQREPVFLLNRPGTVLSGFFAASTEAAHLIAMQNLLTDRIRRAKSEKSRQEKRMAGLVAEIDRLAPLPGLELRLEAGEALEAELGAGEHRAEALAGLLAARERLSRQAAACGAAGSALAALGAPPALAQTAPLAATVATAEALVRRKALAASQQAALAALAAPPPLADSALCDRRRAELSRLRQALAHARKKSAALARLSPPPDLGDAVSLEATRDRLTAGRAAAARLASRAQALARLSPPPETADPGPLAALAAQLAAARQTVAAASATLDRRARSLADMAVRVAARLQALGSCPLCGGALSAGDFLGGGHVHAPEKDAS
ncbi:AAA family ATPase [Solidesulfovibrio alcoholivorans]|uniref:AAA family ATPase n=1 Tax=Solidesulfovibrio alcoholivorans TaxID=81406 RepID=UPI000A72051C|nr:AAA family ATPase [Solidesulfovibrio alcoholivorans]